MPTTTVSLAIIAALAALVPSASATAAHQPELVRRQYYSAWDWYPSYGAGFVLPGLTSAATLPVVGSAGVAPAAAAPTVPFVASTAASTAPFLAKRQHEYGGYSRYGGWGWGFPFVSLFNNEFDGVSNRANFNENTLYTNNINANQANDAVHSNTNNFVSG
ncbi:hypothetical protein FBU59_001319 [Linderina macrospora]|uniref:Uncharacterized protein n=1 Tax=Linderina macrospora TaxID=4868 RepID=A0ACC1JE56_9FUNG|nr:hypothetical protein FBU59_001319 [Linderina macrospora]